MCEDMNTAQFVVVAVAFLICLTVAFVTGYQHGLDVAGKSQETPDAEE